MIINIPIQINEEEMTKVIEKDYQEKVIDEIVKYIKTALASQSQNYYGDKVNDGMISVIKQRIDIYLEQYKDQIIEIAGKHLADKLAKTKAGKELLQEVQK